MKFEKVFCLKVFRKEKVSRWNRKIEIHENKNRDEEINQFAPEANPLCPCRIPQSTQCYPEAEKLFC